MVSFSAFGHAYTAQGRRKPDDLLMFAFTDNTKEITVVQLDFEEQSENETSFQKNEHQ